MHQPDAGSMYRDVGARRQAIPTSQGLAPYWFEVGGQLFLSNTGDATARFEAEYDQRITDKLILQPLVRTQVLLQRSSRAASAQQDGLWADPRSRS